MILTKPEILKRIKEKDVVISPFDKKAIGPASIDLTLGSTIRVFNEPIPLIQVKEKADYKKYTRSLSIKNGFILKPGQLVLGITKEKIKLPGNLCGWVQSRSRFARLGLMSHITAPFINPGVHNKTVLEIYNASQHNLKLMPGVKICQLILQECKGNAVYKGKWKNQTL